VKIGHTCRECKAAVHSYILCDAVLMPLEGAYFCSKSCLLKFNASSEDEPLPLNRRPGQAISAANAPAPASSSLLDLLEDEDINFDELAGQGNSTSTATVLTDGDVEDGQAVVSTAAAASAAPFDGSLAAFAQHLRDAMGVAEGSGGLGDGCGGGDGGSVHGGGDGGSVRGGGDEGVGSGGDGGRSRGAAFFGGGGPPGVHLTEKG